MRSQDGHLLGKQLVDDCLAGELRQQLEQIEDELFEALADYPLFPFTHPVAHLRGVEAIVTLRYPRIANQPVVALYRIVPSRVWRTA